MSKTACVSVTCIGKAEPGQDGVVSCEIIPIEDLDDEQLEEIFESSPDWVMEKRPEWVKDHHPEFIQ